MVKQEKEVGVGNLIGKAKARQSKIIIKNEKRDRTTSKFMEKH